MCRHEMLLQDTRAALSRPGERTSGPHGARDVVQLYAYPRPWHDLAATDRSTLTPHSSGTSPSQFASRAVPSTTICNKDPSAQ